MTPKDILSRYFKTQRGLVEAKQIDDRSVMVSLPLHYSGFTRVEFAITQVTPDQFVLSDLAQTLGELRDSGYAVTDKLRERIVEITRIWHLSLSGDHLTRTCSAKELGDAIHEFAEATKTIGDAYLAYPTRLVKTAEEEEVRQKVRQTLLARQLLYQERQTIQGKIESHKVDFYVHPNGKKGLAVAILANPDHIHAEAWGFKAQDLRNHQPRLLIGVVYNAKVAKELSRNILDRMADIPVASTELERFGERLDDYGLSPTELTQ